MIEGEVRRGVLPSETGAIILLVSVTEGVLEELRGGEVDFSPTSGLVDISLRSSTSGRISDQMLSSKFIFYSRTNKYQGRVEDTNLLLCRKEYGPVIEPKILFDLIESHLTSYIEDLVGNVCITRFIVGIHAKHVRTYGSSSFT